MMPIVLSGPLAVLLALLLILIIGLLVLRGKGDRDWQAETPAEAAGRQGEIEAAEIIRSVLRQGDRWFTNVTVEYGESETELDNVIVNQNGVFILEIKNYSGQLEGGEDDYKWTKYRTSAAGITYAKRVKNPIPQVKREVYLLAKMLEYHGFRVWIDGYAFLLQGNSPVQNEYILFDADDIDRAVHSAGRQHLSEDTVQAIAELMS